MQHERESAEHTDGAAGRVGKPNGIPPESGVSGVLAGAYFEGSRGADLGTTIVRVVAEAEGVPPESVDHPPLYDRIDVEHLRKAMFGPETGGDRETTVTFPYRGHRVHVRGDGYVCVADAARG